MSEANASRASRILDLALSLEPCESSVRRVRDLLEVYYINFPPRLLAFSAVNHIHEAEAMIWLHGIHIVAGKPRSASLHQEQGRLLTVAERGLDLIDMFFDESLPSQAAFYTCYEHAILMAEVCILWC